jgi:hypothetical protein
MRIALLVASSTAVLGLAACDGVDLPRYDKSKEASRLKVVSELACPESEGDLTRVRVNADGTCDYAGPRGAEVRLRLIAATAENADAALKPLETELKAVLPRAAAAAAAGVEGPTPEPKPAHVGVAVAGQGADEKVDVNLPGMRIRTEGESAIVRLPGIKIEANDGETDGADGAARVDITVGGKMVLVRTRDEASEIRTSHDGPDLRRTYVLVDSRVDDADFRLVGYEAAGPGAGPLVVAVVKSKATEEADDALKDAKKLVEANVGRLR